MPTLFDEVTLGGVTIKNRFAMAPMGVIHDLDGGISPAQKAYLAERAKGGFGLIYPSAHTVTDKYELPMYSGNYLHNYSQAMRLQAAVEEVHRYGAKFAIQLTPGYGRVNVGPPPQTVHVSASDNTVFYYPDHKCRALTVDEIHELVANMGTAAWYAKSAGVDIIELHAYGGYLFDQFMSKIWNRRDDEYGGSLDNRMRFFNECYYAVRQTVGPDFPLSVKFTPQHGIPGGRTFEDEGLEIARRLDNMGFAYIHLDDGCYERYNRAIPCAYDPAGSQVYVAERLRKEGIKSPLLIQGKLNDPETAKRLIESGVADMIALGKQSIADPFYPTKLKAGHIEDINFCTACCECMNIGGLDGHQMGCAINPMAMHENEYTMPEAKQKRKILVIGGGPGGMYTAKLAVEQGHTVELWEKSGRLGGNVNAAGGPDFKFDMKRFCENLQKQVYKAGVNVRLMKEATRQAVDEFKPDVVIVAAGARPVIPPIDGIDRENVVEACALLTGKASAGQKVVVLGGGEVGCEAALYLERQGKQVTIVEMADKILSAKMANNARIGLNNYLNESSIKVLTNTKLVQVKEGSVKLADSTGESELECDTVILAVGFKPDHSLTDALKGGSYKVFTIGDYNLPRKVWYAVHEGFHIISRLDDLMLGC
jgi:2-enoate reductase